MTQDVDSVSSETRKRKIDHLLQILDTPVAKAAHRKIPSFAPWDRSALSHRLATFRQYSVHTLESPVSAFRLARYGWQYISADTVECVTCHHRFMIPLRTDDEDVLEALQVRFGEHVTTQHKTNCPWKSKPCEVGLFKQSFADGRQALADFKSRCSTMQGLSQDVIAPEDIRSFEPASQLAILNWTPETTYVNADRVLVTCSCCHARAFLIESFDVVSEHRDYCPWICATVQGSEPGWQTMLKLYTDSQKPAVNGHISTGAEIRAEVRRMTNLFSI